MKKILLLLSFIILSGCTAEYNLEYVDNTLKEEFVIEADSYEYCGEYLCSNYINSYYNTNISINYLDNEEELASNDDLSKYTFYNKSLINSSGKYGMILEYDFDDQAKYSTSYISRKLFNNVIVNDEKIYAYDINNIFENYIYLSEIVVSFSTDKFVSSTNCDEEKDNKYFWYINKNNYQGKVISIQFDVETNEENTMVKNGYLTWNSVKYIFLILLVIVLVIILIIYEKVRKSNK